MALRVARWWADRTGKFAGAYPQIIDQNGLLAPNPLYLDGGRDLSAYDQYWLPFQHLYVPGRTFRFYMQFKLGKGL